MTECFGQYGFEFNTTPCHIFDRQMPCRQCHIYDGFIEVGTLIWISCRIFYRQTAFQRCEFFVDCSTGAAFFELLVALASRSNGFSISVKPKIFLLLPANVVLNFLGHTRGQTNGFGPIVPAATMTDRNSKIRLKFSAHSGRDNRLLTPFPTKIRSFKNR